MVTQGGYSQEIVVQHHFVVPIPAGMDMAAAAPLLCAGITAYAPLKRFGCKWGTKVLVAGLGGLGHMFIKIAKAMGADVTVVSRNKAKEAEAKHLGASLITVDEAKFHSQEFDLLMDTIPANHDYNAYLPFVAVGGTYVLIGAPAEIGTLHPFGLIFSKISIAGSLIGGIEDTRDMLAFCHRHKITADIKIIPASKINDAYVTLNSGTEATRFVIDASTIAK